ncbi:hypothetical protein TSUD_142440 [Trifolium subterraneum]|uniref:Reverse transcriptase zinc-binding domain-containing protein n=1 Tax=Trifolium subterraneum TaxID=3900 RepID=A0A2Z6LTK2_TRISU|nr:hypothetical protein TSUD_142440 [Trifolium subterraneum]
MLVDREGLWYRVLAARYGVEGDRLRVGGRRGSVWWREIVRIREGGEPGGSWFGEHVSKRVADGSNTFFWTDPWVDEISLCERFGRMFDLAETKLRTAQSSDRWQWQPEPDTSYTVPLKATIFAWRLLRDRLPTKANLVLVASYLPQLTFVFLVVERSRRHITYSSSAVLLVLFGH